MSLYEITEEMRLVQAAFERCSGEGDSCDPEGQDAMLQHIDALAEAFDAKADSYAALIRDAEARSEARKAEATRMLALSAADALLADRLRDALMQAMERTGRKKVHTQRFALTLARKGGKAPIVVEDPDLLPEEFKVPRMTMTVDKEAIRTALEAGVAVPGAALGERGVRLDIK